WQWQPDLDEGSFEGFYLRLATLAGQVTYQSKPGYSRDFIFGGSSLCFWLRRG
ncbi:hypothetical protein A2U01_0067262, partial [Trifolium medium]|nr:hypothetical protein [Trifolium medium]